MKEIFDHVALKCSRITTCTYSTSFSLGIRCLERPLRNSIYSIYGFVRFADEIVDTFHEYDKEALLSKFREDTYAAIDEGISLNPILHSFQRTVNEFGIERVLIDQFLQSMEMDLTELNYSQQEYETYILGSAEVVGLMCLRIFCYGNEEEYQRLKPYAMKLGSAFQKVNFLRDLNTDFIGMGRTYFPNLRNVHEFDESSKKIIEEDIEQDFQQAYEGIVQLPKSSRFGVYLAYVYYRTLFNKIKRTPSAHVIDARIRIPNQRKFSILFYTYLRHRLNIL